MFMMSKRKKVFFLMLLFLLTGGMAMTGILNCHVRHTAAPFIHKDCRGIPPMQTALILGAMVYRQGRLSPVLQDRMSAGLELYRKGLVKKLLLSGDHGSRYYDEVNGMKRFLLARGVRAEDIFLDHAGFRTLDSVIRAQEVFQVRDLVIVTQAYHLPRAVYTARKRGLRAYGYVADRREYLGIRKYRLREYFAAVVAFLDLMLGRDPKFLGKVIPITGDGRKSWD